MLTVEILKTLKSDIQVFRFLEKIENINKDFYWYIINNFPVCLMIETLLEKNKCYLPSGLVIEVKENLFQLTNIFDKNYLVLTESIFNF